MTDKQLKAEVEAWLAANWRGTATHKESFGRDPRAEWLAKVRDAGWAVPRWPSDFYGRGLADEQARIVERAFAVLHSGRPGPVVVSLPEDMLVSAVEAPAALPFTPVQTYPGVAELDALEMLLGTAKRPFVILGGTRWSPDAVAQMKTIAENWALPVGCSFRRQMLFDHLHPNYAGDVGIGINPKLGNAIKEADVVLLIGGRMGEMPSSDYTILKSPYPDQALVHVHADANELGRVYRPTLAINASPAAFVEAFAKRRPKAAPAWAAETAKLHDTYLGWSTTPKTGPGLPGKRVA